MENVQESRAARSIREAMETGRPLVYIQSSEEQRVERVLAEVAARRDIPVWTWSLTEGLRRDGAPAEAGHRRTPRKALDFIVAHPGGAIFHLKDFHEPLRESPRSAAGCATSTPVRSTARKFVRDLLAGAVRSRRGRAQHAVPRTAAARSGGTDRVPARRNERPRRQRRRLHQMARALQGLTLDEARYALRRARRLGPAARDRIDAARCSRRNACWSTAAASSNSSPTHVNLGEVGGLEGLKKWLLERRKLFQMRDDLSTEIVPKGLLMMGIPGCGKSLCVKAIASSFQLPLYRIDMTEIFSGRHGKPEGVFVEACRMMEDMSPAVLWFDEIEMGITSTESGGEQGRIFAFFLTWMQEKTRGLFVAATANRIDLLPAEMIRKGRFDEVFFVDLPLADEQIEIFRIHLARRGVDASKFNLAQMTQFTVGWTGAEIEQCVVSAITRARLEDRDDHRARPDRHRREDSSRSPAP